MKVKLLQTCSVVAYEGSIVEVSEAQYKALGDFCTLVEDKKVPEKVEKPIEEPKPETKEPVKKPARAKAKK